MRDFLPVPWKVNEASLLYQSGSPERRSIVAILDSCALQELSD